MVIPPTLLARSRLIELLERPYLASISTIVAGAGFGKTTLARQWSELSGTSTRWVAAEIGDCDNSRFRKSLLDALHSLAVDETEPAALLRANDDYTLPVIPGAHLSAVTAITRESCLVIDKCENLTDLRTIELVNGLLTILPENLNVFLISRRPLTFRLGRLRSQGRVRDITGDDLRFSKQETMSFLEMQPAVDLTPRQMIDAWASTGGWITGIVLTQVPLHHGQGSIDPKQENLVAVNDDQQRFWDEYIQQEILDLLPSDLQDFVYQTAGLPYLTAELCDGVLGVDDCGILLKRLAGELPFISQIEASTPTYRYETLFAESLRRIVAKTLPVADGRSLHSRAANVLLATGDLEAAAGSALQSGDDSLIELVFEQFCRYLAERSDQEAISTWLDQLGDTIIDNNLHLGYWRISARIAQRRTFGIANLINALESQMLLTSDPLHIGRASLCQGMLALVDGRTDEAKRRVSEALHILPQDAYVERLQAATSLGRAEFRQGNDAAADLAVEDAISYAAMLPLNEFWSWRMVAADRANAYALRGDLFSATTKYRLMLAELPDSLQSLEGFLRCRLINIAIERNELDIASDEFELVSRLVGTEQRRWHHEAILVRMRLLMALGQKDEAERWGSSHVRELRRLPEKTQMVLLLAQLWLGREEFSMVRSWLQDVGNPAYPWEQELGDINPYILAVDLDLAESNWKHAAKVARTFADEAAKRNLRSEFLRFSVRSAIAQHELGNAEDGLAILRSAIQVGAKGGFLRSFDVPGFDLVAMYKDAWNESKATLDLKTDLQRLRRRSTTGPSTILTRRELEVIRLVAQGLSNQQISDTIFISVNTVRNHLARICRRLEANSRTEAVAKARQMGIID